MKKMFFAFLCLPAAALAQQWHTITHVVDGDTFIVDGVRQVRLLGINTPEVAGAHTTAEPYGAEASIFTKTWLNGKKIRLETQETMFDRYGRMLAHAYLEDGTWINQRLVQQGYAHVYSFPDNRKLTTELLFAENIARKTDKGLWALPRWEIKQAEETFKEDDIGLFQLVEGTVKHTAKVKGTVYLNFGEDWRTDFTVEIRPQDVSRFPPNPETFYQGKRLRVHGVTKPVNGVLITSTHPEQLEILN